MLLQVREARWPWAHSSGPRGGIPGAACLSPLGLLQGTEAGPGGQDSTTAPWAVGESSCVPGRIARFLRLISRRRWLRLWSSLELSVRALVPHRGGVLCCSCHTAWSQRAGQGQVRGSKEQGRLSPDFSGRGKQLPTQAVQGSRCPGSGAKAEEVLTSWGPSAWPGVEGEDTGNHSATRGR